MMEYKVHTPYGNVEISLSQGTISDELDRDEIWRAAGESYTLQQEIYDIDVIGSIMETLGIEPEQYQVELTDFGAAAVWTAAGIEYRLQVDAEGSYLTLQEVVD